MYYKQLFHKATGRSPYPYQERLAADLFDLVNAPTGAGKTAAAILAWLWRRRFADDSIRLSTPRRLVYCLPMRALVEQTYAEAVDWLERLELFASESDGARDLAANSSDHIAVHLLMGGEARTEWYLFPEQDAILIGTQDMLLSRALNRGYAASRFHWPIDFGLLNNDCLWVFDEPQLMRSGVSTSAQLSGFRTKLGVFGPCPSLWMSATLESSWLDTVDLRDKFPLKTLQLGKDHFGDDFDENMPLYKRMTADKTLRALGISAIEDAKGVAKRVLEHHQTGTQTLVVLNTVNRARTVYDAIQKNRKNPNDMLIHSRFRPQEREHLNQRLTEPATDRIIVATQVVEAGVDLSARALFTELAPWSSIVQRIGRCNRTGKDGPGAVYWMDVEGKQSAPYTEEDLKFARKHLGNLEGKSVSPSDLEEYKRDRENEKPGEPFLPFSHLHVLRRRDLLDLFDTTPDLSGNDIDITRFIRGDDRETDVQVFWREIGVEKPEKKEPGPHRQELCSVPIVEIQSFLEKRDRHTGYFWDHLDGLWRRIYDAKREIRPGMTILLPSVMGGYSETVGWDPGSTTPVNTIPQKVNLASNDSMVGDLNSSLSVPLTIAEHSQHVHEELAKMLDGFDLLPEDWKGHLLRSALWHDAGKGHCAFQHGVRKANPALDENQLWAKSGNKNRLRHGRRYFRHELASALAALQHGLPFESAYLIAAHHGKIRLSIRSLPDEDLPNDPETRFALGIHEGDVLPEVKLGAETCPATTLDLTPMQLGGECSWTARALVLRDDVGLFRLAFLEALLRIADRRASEAESKGESA